MSKGVSMEARLKQAVEPAVNRLVGDMAAHMREIIREQFQAFLNGKPGVELSGRRGAKGPVDQLGRSMMCRAPGCHNRSRGPRFRFLCPKHEKSSEKDILAWRKAATSARRKAARAAAKAKKRRKS